VVVRPQEGEGVEFHRRALGLFGDPNLPLDRARGLAVTRLAAAAGVALPAAVAEWYSVPASSPVWRAFNRFDESILRCDGDDPARWWFGRPLGRDESAGAHWAVPPVCYDLRGWIPGPILPLMGECCGGWWWGVVLNGAADPPVVITHDEGETWDVGGPSFSSYVFATLFDATFDDPQGCGREVYLEGHRLEGPDRHRLRQRFRVEPASRVPYPFSSDLTEGPTRRGSGVEGLPGRPGGRAVAFGGGGRYARGGVRCGGRPDLAAGSDFPVQRLTDRRGR
jgi:hypothetical protein